MPYPPLRLTGTAPGGPGAASAGRTARHVLGVAIAALVVGSAGAGVAQEAPMDPAPAATELELPPITVTSRKRREVEQEVPIGMTVLAGDRLDIPKTSTNAGIARSAPNVGFTDLGGQSANLFSIRGVGSFSPVAPDDTSVVLYVDEVPQSVYFLPPPLLDVDRVEILRGPQGTLFGRNTQGGAISIVPRQPSFDPALTVIGEAGTNGYGLVEAVGNAPLVEDRLAGRLALRYSTYDGDIPNRATGGEDGGLDVGAARGTLLFTPGDTTRATLAFTYGRNRDTSPRFLLRDAADFPESAVDPQGLVDSEGYGATLKLSHDFGGAVLDTVTSVQRATSFQRLDLTDAFVFSAFTGLPPSAFDTPGADIQNSDFTQNSYVQEIRLAAPEESPVAWTAGFSFFRSELTLDTDGRSQVPSFVSVNGSQDNELTTNSYSLFGEVTVPLVERLEATAGLRATHEDKDAAYVFRGNGTPGVVSYSSQEASLSETFLTGRAALSYHWTDDVMTYVSIGRGYVAGGFPSVSVNNPFGLPEPDFPASTSWTWEAGVKTTLLDDRLTVNGAVFFNDVKDGHLVVFDPANALFRTAALDYRSYGGEIEAAARLAPGLDLFGGVGYTHAELVDVPASSPTGAGSGNEVPNVPAVSANIGAQYRLPGETFGVGGDFLARGTYQYVGSRAADVANTFDLRSYGIVDARLGWEGDAFDLYAFANNLFDERYEAWGQSFGASTPTVRVGKGRIVGIGAEVRF